MSFTSSPYPAPIEDPVVSVGVAGDRFTINGRVQHVRGFTDFASLEIFRRTGQISPLALQLQQAHHDFVSLTVPALTPRILLMKNRGSLFDLDPRQIADYFDLLPRHADAQQRAGFVPLYVLLADCAANGMSLGYQQDFVGRVGERLAGRPVLAELVNEYDNGPQQVDPLAFDQPAGVCISRGSGTSGAPIPWPLWDWLAIRGRRDAKWLQTIADSAFSFRTGDWGGPHGFARISCPILDTEPNKAGVNYLSTRESYQLAAESAIWNGAAVFHSGAGLTSSPLPPDQLNQAITFFRGLLVPEVP